MSGRSDRGAFSQMTGMRSGYLGMARNPAPRTVVGLQVWRPGASQRADRATQAGARAPPAMMQDQKGRGWAGFDAEGHFARIRRASALRFSKGTASWMVRGGGGWLRTHLILMSRMRCAQQVAEGQSDDGREKLVKSFERRSDQVLGRL